MTAPSRSAAEAAVALIEEAMADKRCPPNTPFVLHTALAALKALIADAGEVEPGAAVESGEDGAVAWAVADSDGNIGAMGWLSMVSYPSAKQMLKLCEGWRFVFAHHAATQPPTLRAVASGQEAKDAAWSLRNIHAQVSAWEDSASYRRSKARADKNKTGEISCDGQCLAYRQVIRLIDAAIDAASGAARGE
jgi:hypothetical protein